MSASKCCVAIATGSLLLLAMLTTGCNHGATPESPAPPSQSAVAAPVPPLPPQMAAMPVWQPDPALSERLEEYQEIAGYQIRVPKGYILANMPSASQPGLTAQFWRLPQRADKSMAILMVVLKKNQLTNSGMKSLDQTFDIEILGVKKRLIDFQQGPTESGYISDLLFRKTSFEGIPKGETTKAFGFCYVGLDGSTTIIIAGQDQEPHNQETLKVINAAILSFRKR